MESLVTVPVKSYEDIDNKIAEGTKSRTVAATNMNATSRSVGEYQQDDKTCFEVICSSFVNK